MRRDASFVLTELSDTCTQHIHTHINNMHTRTRTHTRTHTHTRARATQHTATRYLELYERAVVDVVFDHFARTLQEQRLVGRQFVKDYFLYRRLPASPQTHQNDTWLVLAPHTSSNAIFITWTIAVLRGRGKGGQMAKKKLNEHASRKAELFKLV